MRQTITVLLAAALTIALTGCAGLQARTPQAGITLKTMKVIEKASDPTAKAERIRRVTDDIEAYLNDGALTVTALEWYARERLTRATLTPSDRFMWEEAIAAVSADLRRALPDGTEILTLDARETVRVTLASIRRGIRIQGY